MTDDLISRQAAIAYAISGLTREIDGENWIRVSEVRESIKALSSPQSEIIRCKDCKHWDGHYCHNQWWGDGYAHYTPPIKTEDGYCDWAERKKNES